MKLSKAEIIDAYKINVTGMRDFVNARSESFQNDAELKQSIERAKTFTVVDSLETFEKTMRESGKEYKFRFDEKFIDNLYRLFTNAGFFPKDWETYPMGVHLKKTNIDNKEYLSGTIWYNNSVLTINTYSMECPYIIEFGSGKRFGVKKWGIDEGYFVSDEFTATDFVKREFSRLCCPIPFTNTKQGGALTDFYCGTSSARYTISINDENIIIKDFLTNDIIYEGRENSNWAAKAIENILAKKAIPISQLPPLIFPLNVHVFDKLFAEIKAEEMRKKLKRTGNNESVKEMLGEYDLKRLKGERNSRVNIRRTKQSGGKPNTMKRTASPMRTKFRIKQILASIKRI